MNFKKFGRTENLFDEVYPNLSTTIRYTAINVGNGDFTLSSDIPDTNRTAQLFLLAGNVSSGASTANNGVYNGLSRTTTSIDGYVTIAYVHYNEHASLTDYNVMLNSGSTALPYQPYKDWTAIPYYQHKTATDTLTTLPAVIYPNASSITVGLKGNEEHTGTPSSQNPVVINGTGERTENLFDESTIIYGKWTNSAGSVQDNAYGARTVDISASVITIKIYGVLPYSFSVCWLDSNKGFIERWHEANPSSSNSYTLNPPQNASYFYLQIANGTDPTNPITAEQIASYQIMLNTGSTALPYEPYGYKIPISMGGTTNNVYLGEVQTERQIKKLVLTGEESVVYNTVQGHSRFNIIGLYATSDYTLGLCSHYNYQYANQNYNIYHSSNNSDTNVYIFDDNYTSADDFKSYLQQQYTAGTPVCVWYVLATATTGTVNEPLMKIGDYADTLTTSIPCTAGENTLDVQTTVQPSEVTATFEGWHPVQNTHVMEGLLAENPLCGISTYKDTLNLATGDCTRRIKKLVLTGEENNWTYSAEYTRFTITIPNAYNTGVRTDETPCTHYVSIHDGRPIGDVPNNSVYTAPSAGLVYLSIKNTAYTTLETWKQFLADEYAAGRPVTVYYVLATPTTETITVPTGLSGTEEGYLNRSDTPTPTNPVYPTANTVELWNP